MQVILNGEQREVPDAITVAELLRLLKVRTRAVAVERNRELVPRAQHEQTRLEPGDRIEIVTLVGGG